MTPEIKDIPVLNVLPQRPPFIFISRMLHYDDSSMITETEIYRDDFDECDLIENIAQTCAARIGYYNKYIALRDISIGYIGAVRQLDILRLPHLGETIQTSILIKSTAFGLSLADAIIKGADGQIIAEGEMKIALQDKE